MAAIDTIAIAIKGTELCIGFGKGVAKLYKNIKGADKDIAERLLQGERVVNLLTYDRRVHFERILAQLAVALQQAELVFKSLDAEQESTSTLARLATPTTKSVKVKYAVRQKKQLDRIVESLKTWYSLFNVSWFELTMQSSLRFPNHSASVDSSPSRPIDTLKLLKAVMKENDNDTVNMGTERYGFMDRSFLARDRRSIQYSSAYTGTQAEMPSRTVIVDRVSVIPEADKREVEKDIIKLARTLSVVDPLSFGLLSCIGVIPPRDSQPAVGQSGIQRAQAKEKPSDYQFVFAWPERCHKPETLRSYLSGSMENFPLQRRFEIAGGLAKSVMYVHNARLVHKGLRPENVLIFKGGNGVTASFLIGFEQFRPADSQTFRRGDMIWERNLYRHPDRQGLNPAESYRMEHDIYSLGVCLLEIGLWTSFTVTRGEESTVPEVLVRLARVGKIQDASSRARQTKTILLRMANELLPSRMGDIYTEATKSCLACLDGMDSVAEATEEDSGSGTALTFIEDVLSKLIEINV